MAQKYNPSTGQWEDDEEDSGSLSGGLSNVFNSSSPEMDGSAMTAGVPQFSSGSFSNPQYNLNSLPSGYSWEAPTGSTKNYADPWATSFDYIGSDGSILGKGYDSYQDAIKKLSFTSGLQTHAPTATRAPSGMIGFDEGYYDPGAAATPEQYSWNQYQDHPEFRFEGIGTDPGQDTNFVAPSGTPRFNTKQELYDYLMSQPGSPLTYDSREKYGRSLTEGQLQNMYAQYAGGSLTGEVPDWTYHRAAYNSNQPTAGAGVTGEAAMVGSTPLFGSDGKVLGYKSNLNPEHLRFADTSGRVTSSTYGGTTVDPEVQKILRGIDDNNAFINAGDVDKFGYRSYGSSSYNKEDSAFGGLMKKLVPMAIMGAAGYGLTGLFNGTAAAGLGAGEAVAGLSAADLAGVASVSPWAADAAAGLSGAELLGGATGVGSGLEALGDAGGYNFISPELPGTFPELLGSDLSSLFDISGINGLDASAFDFNSMINGLDPSAFPIDTPAINGLDFGGSSSFIPEAEALSSIPSEMMGPPQAADMEGLFLDDFGGGTNAMGEFTNSRGMLSPQDRIATAMRNLGMERDLAANLTQGGSKMYNFMTQPMGGKRPGLFQAPSPLNTLFRGVGALDSMKQNREAMDYLEKMRAGIDGNASNPNRPRGDFANQQWMNGISNPMAGYQDFMMGGGREFIDKARAAAAKGGRRGSYLNSGKMQSDLASLYMKNQIERQNMIKGGFEGNVNDTSAKAAYDSAMVPMIKNQNAPLFQMLGNTGMQYGLSELFSGW